MSMLELWEIRAGYGRLPVLFDIDLTVDAGEWVTVVGANGAGRSTLLKTILGETNITAGEVFFQGERVTHLSTYRRVATGMAMSPEGRQIFPNLSVKENLRTGANTIPRKEIPAQLERIYEVFPILGERARQRAGSLSGGEQQMVSIGRALMARPQLLMVDELSLGLGPIVVATLTDALHKLCQEQGLGVIVVDEVHVHATTAASDRRLVLEKGRFVSELGLAEAEPFARVR